MTNLNSILKETNNHFPVRGQNGYAGEQDGTKVIFLGTLLITSRKEAKEITLGKSIKIHNARYTPGTGWKVSLAYWNDAKKEDTIIKSKNNINWIY